jgi:hypothetical protein
MVDFKGLEGLYDDINQVGSRPVGLMTEFTTEAGRPIYISNNGEIVSEKSTTIPYNGKYVNVPSIHDGIEYSEFELRKLLDEKKIKPTSTHKTQELAIKAAQKRSPSLMSEETARAVESKYWKEMTKRKATADQILGDSSTELVTPDAKANIQMRNLELINEDDFLGLVDPSEKTDKLDAYMSTLSEQDKLNIQKTLKKPKARINSIEGDESMAKGRARRNLEDQTVSAFAEGGMEDGGLKDEGGTVDPVSGNDVPSGSTQAEVRDDIPAQLSEGEFVFPADVVRYIGLENLMELRSKAKQGLAKMEAMGQMGNSDEATMDDSGEYDGEIDELIESFDPNDPATFEFNEGGVVMAQQGTYVPGQTQQQFSYGYTPPQQQGFQAPGYSVMPQQTQFITDPARVAVGQGPVAVENRTYVGPNDEEIIIPFYDGKPMQGYTIPAGYKYKSPEEAVAETPEIASPVVQQPDGGDSDGDREREAEREAQMKVDKEINNTLASYNAEFAKQWSQDPFNTGKMGIGGPFAAAYESVQTHLGRTAAIEQIAKDLNIDLEDYKNTGIEGFFSKYDDERFARDLQAKMEDEEEEDFPVTEQTGTQIDTSSIASSTTAQEQKAAASRAEALANATQAVRDAFAEEKAKQERAQRSIGADGPDSSSDSGGGGQAAADAAGDASGSSPFAKGGLAEQTQRVLKSSRKKK